jgi:hypothetical protein
VTESRSPIGPLAVAAAVVHASALAWLSDDAFISFRYAKNWIEGRGLVFNAGEHVEGFTNPLWTLFVGVGLKLGVRAETWSIMWGIAAYAGSIALLALLHRRFRPAEGVSFPLAAVLGALHVEWATYATSGLEGSAFTFLALAGFFALVCEKNAWAGALFALATLTRHDGLIFASLGFASLLWPFRRSRREVARYALAFAVIWAPLTLWRIRYFGDYFPNTYYAKSANVAWYGQGLVYAGLYAQRYWTVALGLLLLPLVFRRAALLVAGAFALVYTAYVVRVGGDFMYGRLLVPVTPFALLVLDAAWALAARSIPRFFRAASLVMAGAQFATPSPMTQGTPVAGIVDERAYYDPGYVHHLEEKAAKLTPFVRDLPLRVAIYGDEARIVYLAPIAVAIEAHAGLTDKTVAHQPLTERGRVGHEKHASLPYLVLERRVHMLFSGYPAARLGLDDYVPRVTIDMGGVRARLLHWDPAMLDELRRRGATVDDFPASLDAIIARLPSMSDADVRSEFDKLDHFYFAHVNDPVRRAPFEARLRR